MPWQTPKTNWTSVPGITYNDFNRIEENIRLLRTADNVLIIDTEGHFTSTTLEGALHELYTVTR